jgi:hypothetical protein
MTPRVRPQGPSLIRLLACLVVLVAGLSAQGAGPVIAATAAQDTTVVLIRHAERQSLLDSNSPLSAAGQRRAQALVPLLETFHPAVLFVSDLRRTQQTLAPVAAKLGLVPQVWTHEGSDALAQELLAKHRGQVVVVCWHHDLFKKIARGLGVKGPLPYWSLDSYDPLWVVRVTAKGEATFEARSQDASAPAVAAPAQSR